MRKCLLHAKNRSNALWKSKVPSKRKVLLYLKTVKKTPKEPTGRRINAHRVDPEKVHARRVLFNQEHFGCKTFYHQNGKETWVVPISKEQTPAITVKRIIQILVPSDFFCVTDKTRTKLIYKRDDTHHVISTEEVTVNIKAHGENAVKEMLLKEGINKDSITTNRNVCYVTLHKQVSEEKIREIFPTLNIRVFKVKN